MSEENTYVISDTETELARLQLQGNLLDESLPLFPRLFEPEEHPRAKILDLGCGPGSWVTQVAHLHSTFEVTGVDVNPRMVAYARATAEVQELDVQFHVMDILQPLDFADDTFDLVNLRFGAGFIPVTRAPDVFRECWRVLKPGGVIRNIESVHTSMPSASLHQMAHYIFQALHMVGLTYNPFEMSLSAETARLFQDIGFCSVEQQPHILDMSFGASLYQPMREDMLISTTLLKPFLVEATRVVTHEEFDRLAEEDRKVWGDPRFCAHWYVCSVCGMKSAAGA